MVDRGSLYFVLKCIGARDGGQGGGQLTPKNWGGYDMIYSGKRQHLHICLTNCVTERNKYPST